MKIIKYIPIFIILTVFIIFLGNSSYKNEAVDLSYLKKNVKNVSEEIAEKKQNSVFEKVKLFDYQNNNVKNSNLGKYINTASFMKLRKSDLLNLYNSQKENIILEIPITQSKTIELELTKVKILAEGFSVNAITPSGKVPVQYTPGVYYRGIVKGNPKAIASISIFQDYLMGLVLDETGNYNLGTVEQNKKNTDDYIYVNEFDMSVKSKFKCNVDDYNSKFSGYKIINQHNVSDNITARSSVKVNFVADYRLYLDKGANSTNVSNFLTGIFSQVAMLYQNDYLKVEISTINVYTTTDPYANLTESDQVLLRFGVITQDAFTGDLAHLISSRPAGMGGIAWIGKLCSQYNPQDSSGRFAFSDIDSNYYQFPTYSWTVTVVSHEMGHNFGSRHTFRLCLADYSKHDRPN